VFKRTNQQTNNQPTAPSPFWKIQSNRFDRRQDNNMERVKEEPAERKTLTDFLRKNTTFIIDPVVTFLARYRFSPDALTVLGMLSHFWFAWLIATGTISVCSGGDLADWPAGCV
jgi:hypothetical protein